MLRCGSPGRPAAGPRASGCPRCCAPAGCGHYRRAAALCSACRKRCVSAQCVARDLPVCVTCRMYNARSHATACTSCCACAVVQSARAVLEAPGAAAPAAPQTAQVLCHTCGSEAPAPCGIARPAPAVRLFTPRPRPRPRPGSVRSSVSPCAKLHLSPKRQSPLSHLKASTPGAIRTHETHIRIQYV